MAKKTDTVTPELEAAALRVVASLNEVPAGFVPATPGPRPEVGQVVSCWGHNKQRVGVVTEVTKTRVHVLFTTPGAIKEAQDGLARTLAQPTDLDSYLAANRPSFTDNYLFFMLQARPETAKYTRYTTEAEYIGYADRLCAIEDQGFEAALLAQAQADLDGVLRRREIPWQARVGYTHSWKKLSEVFVLPEGA